MSNPKRLTSKRPRKKRDLYQTPHGLVRAAIDLFVDTVILHSDDLFIFCIVDLGCGDGRWAEYWKERRPQDVVYGIDVSSELFPPESETNVIYIEHDVLDYRELELPPIDFIIGNPPFSLAELFVRAAYGLDAEDIFFLFPISFSGSQTRYNGLFQDKFYAKKWVLSRRPSFFSTESGNKTTDMMEYGLFCWQTRESFGYAEERVFMWDYHILDYFERDWEIRAIDFERLKNQFQTLGLKLPDLPKLSWLPLVGE